jgi:hypothetical protein
MRRLASAFLYACLLLCLAVLARPASAQDYYYGDGYTHHYYHPYYDGGYYHPHRHSQVWYSSSCCYRKVVRHVRTVHYERVDEGYPYYRDDEYRYGGYERPYHHYYYEHPYRYGTYEHPYHHAYYGHPYRYGYYEHPYYRHRYYDYHRYDNDYLYRPYRHYDLGYDSVGYGRYAQCRLKPLPDGHGGFLPSRKAGCYSHAVW